MDLYKIFRNCPRVCTDTRHLVPDSIFFALHGANFDGNRFALDALRAGCAYAVVDAPCLEITPATEGADFTPQELVDRLIVVPDTLRALQDLAATHRRAWGGPIIQITGTNGKTTTKELCAAVLARYGQVLFTEGNLNNHIGVPLTLLRLTDEHRVAVIETGASHEGEIAALSEIVDADMGIITNCGEAHLEGFGSFEGVVRTKTELFRHLSAKESAHIFLNADQKELAPHSQGMHVTRYGVEAEDVDVQGEVVGCRPYLTLRWRSRDAARDGAFGDWQEVSTHLIGAYNIHNALAAISVGLHFGLSPADVNGALAAYIPRNARSQLVETSRNRLVVDAYNANVTSMRAALESFSLMEGEEKMVILGEMRELGAASAEAHADLLRRLALVKGLRTVWLVGDEMQRAAIGFEWPPTVREVRLFADVEAVKAALAEAVPSQRLILVKGSNSNRLYTLPELL